MATAITYRTCEKRSALRTVLCDEVRATTVLLPTGRLAIVTGTLLHGQVCRHAWWAEILGIDPDSDAFAVATEQVVQTREIGPVKTNCK